MNIKNIKKFHNINHYFLNDFIQRFHNYYSFYKVYQSYNFHN